jgi:uncharacterized protein
LDLYIWILAATVIFIASLTMSVVGFGFGLIATPILLLFLDSKTVVLFSAGLGSITGLLVFIQTRYFAKPKIIAILGISSLIGLPIGILMIDHISAPILKIVIGILVIIFAVLFASGRTFKNPRENLGSALSGFIGGLLMSGTGLGGPPVSLYLINQNYEKQLFRACIAAYFVISGMTTFAALGISGTVSGSRLLQALTFIPLVVIAYFIGKKILPHINQSLFRIIILAVIILSGTAGVITAVIALTK